jgi:hypothetical protein
MICGTSSTSHLRAAPGRPREHLSLRTGAAGKGGPFFLFRSAGDGQANLATKRGEARIVFAAQDEGVEEDVRHARIAARPSPIEPLEGRLCVAAQRIDLRDLIGRDAGILFDQRLERRVGRAAVTADLPCEDKRVIVPRSRRLLLRSSATQPKAKIHPADSPSIRIHVVEGALAARSVFKYAQNMSATAPASASTSERERFCTEIVFPVEDITTPTKSAANARSRADALGSASLMNLSMRRRPSSA